MKSIPLAAIVWLACFCSCGAALAQQPSQQQQVGPYPVARGAPLLGVPVGAVIPYLGPLDALPPEWLPCDGREVKDPASPLYGKRLPNLADDRFVMGVDSAHRINSTGGRNDIPADGVHQHSGETRPATYGSLAGVARIQNESIDPPRHTHSFSTDQAGAHQHGGDNRPRYLASYYIVRIK